MVAKGKKPSGKCHFSGSNASSDGNFAISREIAGFFESNFRAIFVGPVSPRWSRLQTLEKLASWRYLFASLSLWISPKWDLNKTRCSWVTPELSFCKFHSPKKTHQSSLRPLRPGHFCCHTSRNTTFAAADGGLLEIPTNPFPSWQSKDTPPLCLIKGSCWLIIPSYGLRNWVMGTPIGRGTLRFPWIQPPSDQPWLFPTKNDPSPTVRSAWFKPLPPFFRAFSHCFAHSWRAGFFTKRHGHLPCFWNSNLGSKHPTIPPPPSAKKKTPLPPPPQQKKQKTRPPKKKTLKKKTFPQLFLPKKKSYLQTSFMSSPFSSAKLQCTVRT